MPGASSLAGGCDPQRAETRRCKASPRRWAVSPHLTACSFLCSNSRARAEDAGLKGRRLHQSGPVVPEADRGLDLGAQLWRQRSTSVQLCDVLACRTPDTLVPVEWAGPWFRNRSPPPARGPQVGISPLADAGLIKQGPGRHCTAHRSLGVSTAPQAPPQFPRNAALLKVLPTPGLSPWFSPMS